MPIPTLADYDAQRFTSPGGHRQTRSICPRISVITVVKNNAYSLAMTIESIRSQTYRDFEYIVIDGGSTDQTLAVIDHYQDVIDCWISEPDCGVYDAMNKGIARARGQMIATLNAGDTYLPETLALVAQAFAQATTKNVMIAGNLAAKTKHGFCLIKQAYTGFGRWHIAMHQPALFVARSIYQQIGLFDTSYRIAGDYDFILRTYRQVELIFLAQVLTQTAPEGLSGDLYAATLESHQARLANHYPCWAAYGVTAVKLVRVSLHLLLDKMKAWQILERIRHQTAVYQPKLPR